MSEAAAVPGITQAALDAVQDANARQVLQELVSGWQTRNGAAGKKENQFLTEGALTQLVNGGTLGQLIKRTAASEAAKVAGSLELLVADWL